MIRKDREVTDFNDLLSIIEHCDVCTLGLNNKEGYPYLVPLNFGYKVEEGHLILYFHSALKGRKLELMEEDNRASFEMDCNHQLGSNAERGYCTMNYESVIGQGRISFIEDEEQKVEALTIITDRYHPEGHFAFSHAALPRVKVYQLEVTYLTGKRKESKI